MLYLQTLGRLALYPHRTSDSPLASHIRPLLVLVYLALEGGEADRDRVAELIWPEPGREKALASLRNALYTLRRISGRDLLVRDDLRVRLLPELVEVDALLLREAATAGSYVEAAELIRGRFLQGQEGRLGRELDEWIALTNDRLRVLTDEVVPRATALHLQAGRLSEAQSLARAYHRDNPLTSSGVELLVAALLAAGRRGEALETIEAHSLLLDTELDEPLSTSLEERRSELRTSLAHEVEIPDFVPEPHPVPDSRDGAGPPRRARWRLVGLGLASAIAVAVAAAATLLAPAADQGATPTGVTRLFATTVDGEIIRIDMLREGPRITEVGLWDRYLVASPDGTAFLTDISSESGKDLAFLDSTGSLLSARVGTPTDEIPHDWSPDGRLVLFGSGAPLREGRDYSFELSVLDRESGRSWSVTPLRRSGGTYGAWSPDGSTIAFTADPGGVYGLYTVQPDGTDLARLPVDGDFIGYPTWSPDGVSLAFVATRGDVRTLGIVDLTVKEVTRVRSVRHRLVSPKWLAAEEIAYVLATGEAGDIWIRTVANGSERQLTELGTVSTIIGVSGASEPWIETVRVPADTVRMKLDGYYGLGATVERSDGTHANARVEWSTSDSAVVSVEGNLLRPRAVGEARVIGTVGGWRTDTVTVIVGDVTIREAVESFSDDWTRGLDLEKWIPFGSPGPSVRTDGGPRGGGVFLSNGDRNYQSGAVSREAFSLVDGLTVEVWGSAPFQGVHYQDLTLALVERLRPPATMAMMPPPFVAAVHAHGQTGTLAVYAPPLAFRVPLPADPGAWHLYGLQVSGDGQVAVFVDGSPVLHTELDLESLAADRIHVALAGNSVGREILHGTVRVFRGARYP